MGCIQLSLKLSAFLGIVCLLLLCWCSNPPTLCCWHSFIIIMNQQKANSHSDHFDFIVNALYKKKRRSIVKEQGHIEPAQSFKKLYETMSGVVMSLDEKIGECKKYNESKIHRKYQIIIMDLQKRIQFLQIKIQQQNKARSPSKKYIQNLVDKLVTNKFQIQNLNKLNDDLARQNTQLKRKLKIYEQNQYINDKQESSKIDNSIAKQDYFKTQAPIQQLSNFAIKNEVLSFLNFKSQIRKHQGTQKTKFERFLIKNKQKMEAWSMRQFLQSIDKWLLQNIQTHNDKTIINEILNQKLKHKARYSIQQRNTFNRTQQRNRRNLFTNFSVSTKNQFPSYILR